jgi:hypothetical protein
MACTGILTSQLVVQKPKHKVLELNVLVKRFLGQVMEQITSEDT